MTQNSTLLPSRSKLIVAAFLLLLAILLGALALMVAKPAATGTGAPLIGGPFTMLNEKGETVTDKTFAGTYMLMFFGFTKCGDVCPAELQIMASALTEMGAQAEKITPLFVSIDPERDTPHIMADYVKNFHPRLQGLTGSVEQVAQFAKLYHIFYQKVPNPKNAQDYEMDHSSIMYLMGPDGKFIKHFPYTTDAKGLAQQLAAALQ
jgi:cytochrome oxidase Cu insertion factor (SCO1/SenC/PrrC family)